MRHYKDSGIEWIGKIPETWAYKRFKYSGVFEKGKLPHSSNIERIGLPIIGASEMLGKDARTYTSDTTVPRCKVDDILILWDGANAGITASGLDGVVSSTAVKYTCIDKSILSKYAAYMLKYGEHYFKEKVNGTTIPHMNMVYINDIPLLCPPFLEQLRIVDYLDSKCEEIDLLIGLQEQMIEKLKAYKQSVITETVTKGLDTNVNLVPSGIEWIDRIPEGWKIIRIKNLLKERKERSETGEEEPLSMSQKFGLIPTKDMDMIPNMASSFVGAKVVYKSDLVFNKLKAHLGVFSVSKYYGLVSPDYAVYYSTGRADLKYLEYLFKTPQCIGEFRKRSTGVGAGLTRLYTDDLYSILIPFPSLQEQHNIAIYLDEKCADIDSLIILKQKKIEALKDYKKSVIYEVVTGKTIIE